jgi:hypothetical protein
MLKNLSKENLILCSFLKNITLSNMKTTTLAFFFAVFASVQLCRADSPITSTPFWEAYKSEKIIADAMQASGSLTPELAEFLISKKNKIAVKMAVINCLSWDLNGKSNSDFFLKYLYEKNIYTDQDNFKSEGRADHLLCMAYLKAMDDYFNVNEALAWADLAIQKNKKSFTFAMIHALINAQYEFDNNWCLVYMVTHSVRTNDKLKKDMTDDAITIIFDYMDLYKEYCEQ